jgi:hypothetical protein
MHLNPEKRPNQFRTGQVNSVSNFVRELLDDYDPQFESRNIKLELDFDPIESAFDDSLIKAATIALLENAIESMPTGGELSVTLIDGSHQWELEVADTVGMAFSSHDCDSKDESVDLPVIIPFPETDRLRAAHRAALAHGGQIQTWNCPQGGTAQVLVVPKRPVRTNQAKSTGSETA